MSNIDQVLNFHVKGVVFFAASPEHPLCSVVDRLRSAMEKLLVLYNFVAGEAVLDLKIKNKGIGSTMLIFEINKIKGYNFIIDQTLKLIYLISL